MPNVLPVFTPPLAPVSVTPEEAIGPLPTKVPPLSIVSEPMLTGTSAVTPPVAPALTEVLPVNVIPPGEPLAVTTPLAIERLPKVEVPVVLALSVVSAMTVNGVVDISRLPLTSGA